VIPDRLHVGSLSTTLSPNVNMCRRGKVALL
jgi:hypothetical protein